MKSLKIFALLLTLVMALSLFGCNDDRMDELVEYLDTFGNLYCIGRNGQHHYNNKDHSMACAMEAVNNIKTGKTSKVNVWNVNTEKSYHESK